MDTFEWAPYLLAYGVTHDTAHEQSLLDIANSISELPSGAAAEPWKQVPRTPHLSLLPCLTRRERENAGMEVAEGGRGWQASGSERGYPASSWEGWWSHSEGRGRRRGRGKGKRGWRW